VTAFGFPHLPALGRKMRSQASSLWFRAAVLGAMILPAVLLAQVSAPPGAAPAVPAGWLHRDLLFPEPGFPERTEAVPVSLGEVSAPVAATMAVPDDWIRHDLVSSPPLFGASRVFPPTGSSEISFETLRPVEGAIPVPSDWSHRHLIFSRPATAEQAARVQKDPRYWQQLYRRQLPMASPTEPMQAAPLGLKPWNPVHRPPSNTSIHRDWSQDLGSGSSAGAGNYPAKFSFLGTSANCAGTGQPDYVVYSTGLTGAVNQASLVAYDNLYSGCSSDGAVPTVYWAYNTLGAVQTSPEFSYDGSQVMFVQTAAGVASLVLLKWTPSSTDTVTMPEAPTVVPPITYPASCFTLPCMTTLPLTNNVGAPNDDTTSSVFYDYSGDIAWVGDSGGWLHEFTPVLNGVPSEVTTGGWPIQLNPTSPTALSSPIYDRITGNVFVGDLGGFFYSVSASTAVVTTSPQLDFGAGIVDGPIVDSTEGLVYVFVSNDGLTTNCNLGTSACAGVYQLPADYFAGDTGLEVEVGVATNPAPLFDGGFDNDYYNSTDATGNLYVCGGASSSAQPTLYQISINASALPAMGVPITRLVISGATPVCSPVTDVYNANATGGAEEYAFVSVEDDGITSLCGSAGCLFNFVTAQWQAGTTYAVGQEILVPNLHIEVVTTGGTSGATVPGWPGLTGHTTGDGSVQWLDQGSLSASTLASWSADRSYPLDARIVDSNGYVEIVSTSGLSGGSVPTWNTVPGGTTVDGTGAHPVTWTNAGVLPSQVLKAVGGTSGIIIDNTVSAGTLAGTSQVYFSTLGNQPTCTGGTGGCAVQASQSGLH
jgi:hypothetical protein